MGGTQKNHLFICIFKMMDSFGVVLGRHLAKIFLYFLSLKIYYMERG